VGCKMMPVIDVFAIAWNEEFMLPYFLKHYDFARNITILDNESTDKTVEIAKSNPKCFVKTWSSYGLQNNLVMTRVKNECWKECDADYVVVCDVDEFVDCRPLELFGVKEVAFKCIGYMMYGMDGQQLESIRRYHLMSAFDKTAVFSPRISAINYGAGAHDAAPSCPVITEPRLILRHYHSLGEEYMVNRYARYATRISPDDIRQGWGTHYLENAEKIRLNHRNAGPSAFEET